MSLTISIISSALVASEFQPPAPENEILVDTDDILFISESLVLRQNDSLLEDTQYMNERRTNEESLFYH